jgi:hypothetical protein
MSKSDRIKHLLTQGKSVSDIVKATKTTRQYVYTVRNRMNKFGIDKIVEGTSPKAIGIAGLSNKPKAIRTHDEPVVDAPKETFWRKVWRIIWK